MLDPDAPRTPTPHRLALAALTAVLTAGSGSALAQTPGEADEAEQCADPGRMRVALVVSGGLSLGAYQAGFLHYFTEYLKRLESRDGSRPALVVGTGASAGSVNAALSAFEMCRDHDNTIETEESILYRTWRGLDVDRLFPADGRSVNPLAIFDREPLMKVAEEVERLTVSSTSSAWLESCQSDLGFVTTRLRSREVPIFRNAPSLKAKRMTEKFVMRFSVQPQDDPSKRHIEFFHFTDRHQDTPHFWLRPGVPGTRPSFINLRDILFASTAFPAAFDPVDMPFHGRSGTSENGQFIDGGVFENVPVRLASKMVDARRKDGPRCPVRYVVLSSEVTPWGNEVVTDSARARSMWAVLGEFAPSFLAASRTTELLTFIDEKMDRGPKLKSVSSTMAATEIFSDRLAMPLRRPSLSSDHLLAFSGFLDEKFRKLDFHMGMLDARHFVATSTLSYWNPTRREQAATVRAVAAVDSALARGGNKLYQCLLFLDRASNGFQGLTSDPSRLEGLDAYCGDPSLAPYLRLAIANIVTTQYVRDNGISHDDNEAFNRYIKALEDQDFELELYNDSIPAKQLPTWIRSKMDRVIGLFSQRQPSPSAVMLTATAGRIGVNELLEYSEPPAVLGLGVHINQGFDVSWDGGRGRHLQHRFGAAARLRRISASAPCPDLFCGAGFGALEYRYAFGHLLSNYWGLELGSEAGFGYVFDTDGEDYPAAMVGASLTATVLQRVYLRFDFQWIPRVDCGTCDEFDDTLLGFGLGFRFHDVRHLE